MLTRCHLHLPRVLSSGGDHLPGKLSGDKLKALADRVRQYPRVGMGDASAMLR
jgi:hypothetical protein